MKQLKIDEDKAKELYPTATKEFKAILEDTFGKDFFNQKITDRIKTWEDVLKASGKTEREVLPYYPTKDDRNEYVLTKQQIRLNATAKIMLIAEVLNEGWTEEWLNNTNKYYPYFTKSFSSRWSFLCFIFWGSDTVHGGGVSYKSDKLATYAGKTFIKEYIEFID